MQYLTQEQAIKLDEELMGKYKYSLVQLMEIAGLAVAQVVTKEYSIEKGNKRVLILCGPGNNGGDGLVCGRYLSLFGYEVTVFYPKQSKNEHLQLLIKQLEIQDIPVVTELSSFEYDVIVDAVFGFSFKGPVRGIFKEIFNHINSLKVPIISVDIPSGWDVEQGYLQDGIQRCDVLISLSAPKLGVKNFKGIHYLGGRFIPLELKNKLHLILPYKENELIVKIN
ncbi:hypothetical protein ENUP19_0054G0008 [Entamoeba nuttalli]|uniref:NAD(P)H-hydrate epimerase n=2 Tax=Entamoeba nuttalli TaxID=412467 RepID=K2GGL1_ENTNP|nr:YjeF-like protein, N-terminus domain containing protein [Entamoeba nuttalli P19]EKE41906.1 YjeF-like protein, N-terminus domain containing protein [Entamoeba nuttalli P19]|eukprot:XP_008855758.1 YjeF-like protein, N-terminus domain containing protein [Entamoeba nuttalli P19]